MPRGFLWGEYLSDDGRIYALRVNADYADQLARGWVTTTDPGSLQYPRGWLPRKVFGFDPAGHRITAVIATTTADLWTGVVQEFDSISNDGSLSTIQVVGRMAERRKPIR